MLINKIGYEHLEYGTNCQDYGIETELHKFIMDGCSEGKHSEVGAKLFGHLIKNGSNVKWAFEIMSEIFNYYKDVRDFLLFTILSLEENADSFTVKACGDGVIIKQNHDDTFEYIEIDQNGAPKYYAYNYIKPEYLTNYTDGVDFDEFVFKKEEYKCIGIASDGLSYILKSPFREEFESLLLQRKQSAIKRLINREHKTFKDDITIII